MSGMSGNTISKVWRVEQWVYKEQPKFLCDNAMWCYEQLFDSGYVPLAERVGVETIRTWYIPMEAVTDKDRFSFHLVPILLALEDAGIRHGDLTRYSVRVLHNQPYLIDFAESRLACDPRPDKRPEGDRHWLTKTMEEIADGA